MDVFQIYLENRVLFPGDFVEGSLQVVNRYPILCGGIVIELVGVGKSCKRGASTSVTYASGRLKVCCFSVETSIIQGTRGVYLLGPPWEPHQGKFVLTVPVDDSFQPPQIDISLTAGDFLLADCTIVVDQFIGLGHVSVPVSRDGIAVGSVTLGLKWEHSSPISVTDFLEIVHRGLPSFFVQVDVISIVFDDKSECRDCCAKLSWRRSSAGSATSVEVEQPVTTSSLNPSADLSSSEIVTGGTVVIHSHVRGIDAVSAESRVHRPLDASLPEHLQVLPSGAYNVRFQIPLPDELPSTFLCDSGSVVFYIEARIDQLQSTSGHVNLPTTVSSVQYFTVAQPHAVSTMMGQSEVQVSLPLPSRLSLGCCTVPWMGEALSLPVHASTDRLAYAPGEIIQVRVEAPCLIDQMPVSIASAQANLIQTVTYLPSKDIESNVLSLPKQMSVTRDAASASHVLTVELTVPALPPSFLAGARCKALQWYEKLEAAGSASDPSNQSVEGRRQRELARWKQGDPFTWEYEVRVALQCVCRGIQYDVSTSVPFVIAVVGLNVLPVALLSTRPTAGPGAEAAPTSRTDTTDQNRGELTSRGLVSEPSAGYRSVPLDESPVDRPPLTKVGSIPSWQSYRAVRAVLPSMRESCVAAPYVHNVNVGRMGLPANYTPQYLVWTLKPPAAPAPGSFPQRPMLDDDDDQPVPDFLNFKF